MRQLKLPLYLNLLPFSHSFSDYFLDYGICEYALIPNISFLSLNKIQKGILEEIITWIFYILKSA